MLSFDLVNFASLLDTPKNHYATNGHNYQRPNSTLYVPGNGGLLHAIALMAGGRESALKQYAPGFPADGNWNVKVENLNFALLGKV